jgi:hypothetical protein
MLRSSSRQDELMSRYCMRPRPPRGFHPVLVKQELILLPGLCFTLTTLSVFRALDSQRESHTPDPRSYVAAAAPSRAPDLDSDLQGAKT